MSVDAIYPVVLSGGIGTRLWPLARESTPKQFLALHGERTLIQDAVLRGKSLGAASPVIICGESHRFIVAEQMRAVGVTPRAIMLEPVARSTAPAAAIAALQVTESDPQGIVLLLPSDHVVENMNAFRNAVRNAAEAAKHGYITTFGVAPTRAEAGYGYIRAGKTLAASDAREVAEFVEKPTPAKADEYLRSGNYLWNSGMLAFRADTMLAALERHAPDVMSACRASFERATRDTDFIRLDSATFGLAPNISIDHAVLEKTEKAAVVPCSFGWSDVGSWSSLWDIEHRDGSGNVLQGDVVVYDATNSFARSDRGLTALVGVRDIAVVVTDDAVLVADKERTQDVKQIVEKLKAAGRSEVSEHATIGRPWGSYRSIDSGTGFQVKEIVVNPGGRLSLQSHRKRAEHWIVVEGEARVTCNDEVSVLKANESIYIPLGAKHRLENLATTPLRLIEVQCGSYLGEDDIERYDDVYGRAGTRN